MMVREALLSMLVLLALASGACNTDRPSHILDPIEGGAADERRFAMAVGPVSGASVVIEQRPLNSSTQGIAIQYTVLHAQVHNDGARSLRFREEDFVLHLGDEAFEAVPIERVVTDSTESGQEARVAKTLALRPNTLEPGESSDGFLFFRTKLKEQEIQVEGLEITLALYGVKHEALIDSVEIPLVVPLPVDEAEDGAPQ